VAFLVSPAASYIAGATIAARRRTDGSNNGRRLLPTLTSERKEPPSVTNPSANVRPGPRRLFDGSGWAKVIPILQFAGHNVVAVQNEMTSLKGDTRKHASRDRRDVGPTVAVGHSYGAR